MSERTVGLLKTAARAGASPTRRDGQVGSSPALHTVGSRLKRLRKLRGVTLEEVSQTVGMSHSFLSMVERGLADISLGRLERLASYFGIPLAELLLDQGLHAQPDVSTSQDGTTVARGPGITYRVFPERAYLGLQLIHVRLAPKSRFTDVLTHKGYDVIFVCRGTVVLLHGDQRFVLGAGTVATYSAAAPHALANERATPAEAFAFTTPPYW